MVAPTFWRNFRNDWPDPQSLLKDKHRAAHLRTLSMEKREVTLEKLAKLLSSTEAPVVRDITSLGISDAIVRRAMALCGLTNERPNDVNLIRVANRLFERRSLDKKSSVASQITTALLIGQDESASLYTAAIELGRSICTSLEPACMICPLRRLCSHSLNERSQ
jgi:hypothetical protein